MLVEGNYDERYPDWSVDITPNPDRAENILFEKVVDWINIQNQYEVMQEELDLLFNWKRAEEKAEKIRSGKLPYLLPKE